jgi:hypothetical protein
MAHPLHSLMTVGLVAHVDGKFGHRIASVVASCVVTSSHALRFVQQATLERCEEVR